MALKMLARVPAESLLSEKGAVCQCYKMLTEISIFYLVYVKSIVQPHFLLHKFMKLGYKTVNKE